MTTRADRAARSRELRKHLRNQSLARMYMAKTIELLNEYPEGPERVKAFELVSAAVTETYAFASNEIHEKVDRITSMLNFDPVERYIKPLGEKR